MHTITLLPNATSIVDLSILDLLIKAGRAIEGYLRSDATLLITR